MGPGLYSEIGKKARDLLYRDYQTDQKFVLTTCTPTGVTVTTTGAKIGDLFVADLSTQLRKKNITTDIKVDINSNLFATMTVDEPAPGAKAILSYAIPDQRSPKAELQFLHEYVGVTTSVGLTANPMVNFSTTVGTGEFAFGTDVSFDSATGAFTKCNVGLSFSQADIIASLNLNNKGDTLIASYFHTVNPLKNTAVGAELSHTFSKSDDTLTLGMMQAFDPLTTFKAKINNYGKASALIQHGWRPKSLMTISVEADAGAIEKTTKVGLAMVLRP
ncbi:mitochondrial outer membrane protein porin of 34 kDa [Amborella trichopoda]|nr:mitochondrial outer membrane protein porin of 34 kDa [Amborella trichopoda]|eukprot:XP_006826371.2 mitochondrial outer membrane protein porin of 34 kDa [Amborella trichopoda]